jgi:hypothetical protein
MLAGVVLAVEGWWYPPGVLAGGSFSRGSVALVALTMAGCGDPESQDPTAQAAMHVEFEGNCASQTSFSIPVGEPATTSTYLGPKATDGMHGASIECDIVTRPGGGVVSADIHQDVFSVMFDATVEQTAEGTYTGVASVVFLIGPDSLASRPVSCSVSVSPEQEFGERRLWADFACAELFSPTVAACSATGTLVVANCGYE